MNTVVCVEEGFNNAFIVSFAGTHDEIGRLQTVLCCYSDGLCHDYIQRGSYRAQKSTKMHTLNQLTNNPVVDLGLVKGGSKSKLHKSQ